MPYHPRSNSVGWHNFFNIFIGTTFIPPFRDKETEAQKRGDVPEVTAMRRRVWSDLTSKPSPTHLPNCTDKETKADEPGAPEPTQRLWSSQGLGVVMAASSEGAAWVTGQIPTSHVLPVVISNVPWLEAANVIMWAGSH